MDLKQAQQDLSTALDAASPTAARLRSAREVLVHHGIVALGLSPRPGLGLEEIIQFAIDAPSTDARRCFAVLLVHAAGVPGLLPSRGPTGATVPAFLERALLN